MLLRLLFHALSEGLLRAFEHLVIAIHPGVRRNGKAGVLQSLLYSGKETSVDLTAARAALDRMTCSGTVQSQLSGLSERIFPIPFQQYSARGICLAKDAQMFSFVVIQFHMISPAYKMGTTADAAVPRVISIFNHVDDPRLCNLHHFFPRFAAFASAFAFAAASLA